MKSSLTPWLRLAAVVALGGGLVPVRAQTKTPASKPAPTATAKTGRVSIDEILGRLPLRVKGQDGASGDMVNFLVVGSREKMRAAMKTAHWVRADKDTTEAIVHAIQSTIAHEGYTEMPMSALYLFGRPQDYGFARALPIAVANERHHFRLWEAPWKTADGQSVWVGAGTHDIGVERDISTGRISHRIDPEVDKERDYIAETLNDAGVVKETRYLLPNDPVLEATTATGGSFHSDGRILVIVLK